MARQRVNLPYDRAADGARVNVMRAAEMLSCSRSWVYKLIEAGHLKAFRIGSRKGLQITVRSLEGYLAKHAVSDNR